jgi:hypothetical protein
MNFRFLSKLLQIIRTNKAFFLAPLLIALIVLAIIIYLMGPAVVVSFLYADY